jgi:hypothetical protein
LQQESAEEFQDIAIEARIIYVHQLQNVFYAIVGEELYFDL